VYSNKYILDWSRVTETMLHIYRSVLDDALCSLDIPMTLFDDDVLPDKSSKLLIDNYYNQIINCIAAASINTIPGKYTNNNNNNLTCKAPVCAKKTSVALDLLTYTLCLGGMILSKKSIISPERLFLNGHMLVDRDMGLNL